jgi:hypothetical protein
MPEVITINGKRLHEVRMPLKSGSDRVVSYMSYPTSRFKASLEGGTLRLGIPLALGMELYRSGVLPQDTQATVIVAIGEGRGQRFVVADVRYPESSSDPVMFTLERVRTPKQRVAGVSEINLPVARPSDRAITP